MLLFIALWLLLNNPDGRHCAYQLLNQTVHTLDETWVNECL